MFMLYRDLCYKHQQMYITDVGRDHEISVVLRFILYPDSLYRGVSTSYEEVGGQPILSELLYPVDIAGIV